jgi:hypothetical protein
MAVCKLERPFARRIGQQVVGASPIVQISDPSGRYEPLSDILTSAAANVSGHCKRIRTCDLTGASPDSTMRPVLGRARLTHCKTSS